MSVAEELHHDPSTIWIGICTSVLKLFAWQMYKPYSFNDTNTWEQSNRSLNAGPSQARAFSTVVILEAGANLPLRSISGQLHEPVANPRWHRSSMSRGRAPSTDGITCGAAFLKESPRRGNGFRWWLGVEALSAGGLARATRALIAESDAGDGCFWPRTFGSAAVSAFLEFHVRQRTKTPRHEQKPQLGHAENRYPSCSHASPPCYYLSMLYIHRHRLVLRSNRKARPDAPGRLRVGPP